MFDIQNYGSFIAAIMIFQLIPGPATFTILRATSKNGLSAGFGAVVGTLLGDLCFMIAAIAGLAAIMQANPTIFQGLQWFGVVYLLWMGFQPLNTEGKSTATRPEPVKSAWVYFRQAFAVSMTNPKVILFFVAFFPLFLRPESSWLTLLIMMLHVTILSFLYQAGLVLIGNQIAIRLMSIPSAGKIASRIAGAALICFALRLAIHNF
jgi:leucine efflux protein